jgi:hypothetical protein
MQLTTHFKTSGDPESKAIGPKSEYINQVSG